jgi:hypothetical protein
MLDKTGLVIQQYPYLPYVVIGILVDLSILHDKFSFFCGLMAHLAISPRTMAEMEVAAEVSWATKRESVIFIRNLELVGDLGLHIVTLTERFLEI